MIKNIPIFKLTATERLWLEEVYNVVKQNKRADYRQIWSKLYRKIPNTFRPVSMNAELVSASGEEIRLLGVVAVEKNFSVLEKINKMVISIRKIILEKPENENIVVKELTAVCELSASEINFLFELISYYGSFWSGSSRSSDSNILETIGIGRNSDVFYRYIRFNSIEELVLESINRKKNEEKLIRSNQKLSDTPQPKQIKSEGYISIKPLFKNRVEKTNPRLCFVLMPYTEEWSQRVYKDLIRKNIDALGLQCLRADDLTGQNIIEDIWIGINQAGLIIADVTNTNPNVMYELGIAHTIGKPTVLITQDTNAIPFDFRHLRHIQYRENTEAVRRFRTDFNRNLIGVYEEWYPNVKLSRK